MVLAAAVGVMVSFAALVPYTFGLFLKPLTHEFGWTRQAVSAAFSCASLMIAAASPVLGLLLDRYGARLIILPCISIFGLAFGSLALLTPHPAHLYAVFLVLGLVGNGTAQLAYSRAVSTWFESRRGVAFALVMTGGGIGAILIPMLAQAVMAARGWREAYAVLGAVALIVGLPVAGRFVHERGEARIAGRLEVRPGAAVKEAVGTRVFWLLACTVFLHAISANGVMTHMSAMLTDRGVSLRGAALAISVLGGASLGGRLLTGWLLDRFFGPAISFVLLLIAGSGMLLLMGATSLASGAMAAALIGFGMGGESDVTPYLLTRYFALRSLSTLYGFMWTAYATGAAGGAVLMGKAFDTTGSYRTLVIELALMSAAGGALMLLMPRYGVADLTAEGPAILSGQTEAVTKGSGLQPPRPDVPAPCSRGSAHR